MLKLPLLFTRLRALALISGALLLNPSCDSSVAEELALAQLAQDCLVNSDCSSPLVCAFQTCHQECQTSRDCESGARCVGAARPYKVCQLEEERLCQRPADCVKGLVCGDDGECRDACQTANDCVENQVCVSGTCADQDELDDSGQLPLASGATHGAEGSSCVYVSDCNGTLLCRGQVCLSECRTDKDCGSGRICEQGRCEQDGTAPSACIYHSDCDLEQGQRCLAGSCHCGCVEARDCPSRQICDGCGCQPDPDATPACDYNSDCEVPGQTCQNGACACECATEQDCVAGYRCDGCGCVDERAPTADGVVDGDVTIQSSLQLQIYRGVKVINGELNVSGPIPDLGDTFDQLQAVDGLVQIGTNALLTSVSFPKLKSAGPIIFSSMERVLSIDLGALESATVVNLNGAPKLSELNLDSYKSGSIDITVGLTSLTLPALEIAPTLSLHEMPLTSLSLPLLQKVSHVRLENLSALKQVTAPNLTTFDDTYGAGQITLKATGLASLSGLFGALTPAQKLSTLRISGNAALSSCEVTSFAATFASVVTTDTANNGPCSP